MKSPACRSAARGASRLPRQRGRAPPIKSYHRFRRHTRFVSRLVREVSSIDPRRSKPERKANEKPARMNRRAINSSHLAVKRGRRRLGCPTGFAQTTCLRDEIIEYRHGVFDPMATESVDRPFRAVIEQLQPKQRLHSAKIDLGFPKHADFAVPNQGERNRRFWTVLQNRGEFDESSRNSQFGKRAFGRVAAH
jgi:hypothetical protein